MLIKGILFDFIGTTVIEKDPATLNRCFKRAFGDHGVLIDDEMIRSGRGKDKKEMITGVLNQLHYPVQLVTPILTSLRNHLEDSLDNFSENNGAIETMNYMRKKGVIVGMGSGLPRDVFEKIINHLKWDVTQFDYIGIAEDIGKGRPHPAMILDMLITFRLPPEEFLKVGDTVADIQEGKNAQVLTAAILSGTQDEKALRMEQPDFVIRSLQELRELI